MRSCLWPPYYIVLLASFGRFGLHRPCWSCVAEAPAMHCRPPPGTRRTTHREIQHYTTTRDDDDDAAPTEKQRLAPKMPLLLRPADDLSFGGPFEIDLTHHCQYIYRCHPARLQFYSPEVTTP